MTPTDTASPGAPVTSNSVAATENPVPTRVVARVNVGERMTRLFEETTRPDGRRWTMTYVADALRARGIDVSRQYLGYLMTGERDEPRLSLVEALADVFEVPVAYFTADYLGRVSSELLPLLAVMHDPATRALLTRADLPEVAAALADPGVADFLARHPLAEVIATLDAPAAQSAIEETMAYRARYTPRR